MEPRQTQAEMEKALAEWQRTRTSGDKQDAPLQFEVQSYPVYYRSNPPFDWQAGIYYGEWLSPRTDTASPPTIEPKPEIRVGATVRYKF